MNDGHKSMSSGESKLRVYSSLPTKEYLMIVIIPVVIGFLGSLLMHPERWLFDVSLALGVIVFLIAFWFCVFMPIYGKLVYVVSASALEIEKSAKVVKSVPRSEIVSVLDRDLAISVVRVKGRPLLLYPGGQKEALLRALS